MVQRKCDFTRWEVSVQGGCWRGEHYLILKLFRVLKQERVFWEWVYYNHSYFNTQHRECVCVYTYMPWKEHIQKCFSQMCGEDYNNNEPNTNDYKIKPSNCKSSLHTSKVNEDYALSKTSSFFTMATKFCIINYNYNNSLEIPTVWFTVTCLK